MSNSTATLMIPPSTESPSSLQLGPTTIAPNASGQFSIPAESVPTMLASGWSLVVASPTTHVP